MRILCFCRDYIIHCFKEFFELFLLLFKLIHAYFRINRDKTSLDIFWLKDDSMEDSDNLPEPAILAQEIVEDLEAALEQFREISDDLAENRMNKDVI